MDSKANPRLMAALQQATAAFGRGQFAAAESQYRIARGLAPGDPFIALGLGHTLRQLHRPADAKAEFAAALKLHPTLATAHLGLGQVCQDMMDMAGAEAGYRQALSLDANLLPAALGLAMVCNHSSRPDEALDLLAGKTAQDSQLSAAIEQVRGTARLVKEENETALAHFERALALTPGNAAALHARTVAQQNLGREDEALDGLRRLVRDNPANLMAHYDLNQLLYRLKRDDEFLRSYDEAEAKIPAAPHFALAKAAFLVRSERPGEALALYERLLKHAPGEPVVLQGMAAAQLKLQQLDAAIASYEQGLKRAPQDLNMLTGVAAAYLMARAPQKAEAAATAALKLAPEEQTALCVLGTAWRLMDDSREHDLYRYDDFVQIFDLEPPPGFSGMAEFCGALDSWLDSQHGDAREHIDQSLRGGTQTGGNLFRPGRNALIDGLRLQIEDAVRRYIAGLPEDARHPFLRRRGRDFKFAGSWSSRLKDQGFHVNHLHPAGWISSAFYIAVPQIVTDTTAKQGWIKFGEPGYDVGLSDPVRRAVQPRAGQLVLFPSYMWHGTVPFHAAQDRTTIAFDVVPVR
jgi:tetratricopeptide (TPR) repeat protein